MIIHVWKGGILNLINNGKIKKNLRYSLVGKNVNWIIE